MTGKPMSRLQASLMFVVMAIGVFGLDMALSSRLRIEAMSTHSDFWRFAFPGDLLGFAVVAFGLRFIVNWSRANRDRAIAKTNRIS
jgi:hypothetical protein